MQNYYFVDFYICLCYSNSARRTKQNKVIGAKVLEKAVTNQPIIRLEKVLFFPYCILYFDNLIPFRKKAAQAENLVLKKGLVYI